MPSWDFVRGPAGVRMLVGAGTAAGMSAAACLAGSGLREADLDDPGFQLEAGQELAVARNLVAALGDRPGLGVDAGTRLTLNTFGVLSYALLSSPTLGDALDSGLRFWGLSSGFARIEREHDEAGARLIVHDDEIPVEVRDLLVERDVGAVLALIGLLVDPRGERLGRLTTRLTGARAAALAAVNPAIEVHGGATRTVLAVGAAQLARRLPQADPATRRALEDECLRLLERRQSRAGMAARVRALLLEDPADMPTLAQLAARLSFDERTLRRRLAAEGVSFRTLRQEVAMTLALELLRGAGLSVAEVARRVGYADPTGFTHAFTRFHGRPPSAARGAVSSPRAAR